MAKIKSTLLVSKTSEFSPRTIVHSERTSPTLLLDQALAYAQAGYYVLPLEPGDKKPLTKLVPHGYKDATIELDKIKKWWAQYPNANIGIACEPSGIVAIDLDKHGRDDGLDEFKKLTNGRSLPLYPAQYTAGSGYHLLFKHPKQDVRSKIGPGIEIKSAGYIVAAPSCVTGKNLVPQKTPLDNLFAYKWVDKRSLLELQPPDLTSWLKDLAKRPNSVGSSNVTAFVDDSPEIQDMCIEILKNYGTVDQGDRNNTTYKAACKLRDHGLPEKATRVLINKYLELVPPLEEGESNRTIRSAYQCAQNPQGLENPMNKLPESSLRYQETSGDNSGQIDNAPPPWPQFPEAALYGLSGEVVHAATKDTEADPAAVLITLLTFFAASIGSNAHVLIGDTKHPARLFSVIVGASSRARKGTSADPIRRLFKKVEEISGILDTKECPSSLQVTDGPLSSGEGLIYAVRDASDTIDDKTKKPKDAGITDKRLLALEGEFGAALKAAQREGNTLSAILRMAWDRGNIAPLIKHNPIKATGAHICVVGHITQKELHTLLQGSDIWNGFANRFLWLCARRSKQTPFPQGLSTDFLDRVAPKLANTIKVAKERELVSFDDATQQIWAAKYSELTTDRPGMIGTVTARAEAQVIRLSLVYALLEESDQIKPQHLNAALSLWQYCEASAAYIFGGSETDPNVNQILLALSKGPKTQTELNKLFSGHMPAGRLKTILGELQSVGRITQDTLGGGRGKGKAATVWSLTPGFSLPFEEGR